MAVTVLPVFTFLSAKLAVPWLSTNVSEPTPVLTLPQLLMVTSVSALYVLLLAARPLMMRLLAVIVAETVLLVASST